MQSNVFLVDPDDGTRHAVRDLAHTMNLGCRSYALGQEFLDAYDESEPGCVVLEVRVPDVNGFEIQERLTARGATTPLVFLSAQATVSIAVRAMRAGALHFLEKPLRENELWDVIEEAVLVDKRRRRLAAERDRVTKRLAQLNPKEQEVLEMIAQGKSKSDIASEIGVCLRTVELRRKQVMRQLGMHSLAELVQFAVLACDGHWEAVYQKQAR